MASDRETSIRRGAEVILALGTDEALEGGLGVTRLAELVGHDKSQVSRALGALAEYGLVERTPGERSYRLGWQIHALAHRVGHPRLVVEGARVIGELVEELEESCSVIVRSGDHLLTIAAESAERSIKAVGWVGATGPILSTAAGRAMLSAKQRSEFDALVARLPPTERTDVTLLDPDLIWERIERDRHRGWWMVDREYDPELCGIAAPVIHPTGEVIAVVSTAGPSYRFTGEAERIGEAARAAADELRACLYERTPAD